MLTPLHLLARTEGEDAIYNGESLDDAARNQAHKNAILKHPDRRLYDAMARAKRIETLVTWKHSNEDAFMVEFVAEFGTTFGLSTGKEVLVAFTSAGEAVETTWARNFRGDPFTMASSTAPRASLRRAPLA